jgi:putative DeoR family transcriptional regulator (stage III sporulation protein D)
MREHIERRVVDTALRFLILNTTVRGMAKEKDYSKSSVYMDLTERLGKLDERLCKQVKGALSTNKNQRAMRGGLATKLKWQKIKEERDNA